jgi:hypothetical protein
MQGRCCEPSETRVGKFLQTGQEPIAMLPIDFNLLPEAFGSAFGLPAARFDQSDALGAGGAGPAAFQVPLPFSVRF